MFGIVITYSADGARRGERGRGSAGSAGGRTAVVGLAEQRDAVLALHRRRDAVAEELGLGAQLADDAHVVRGGDVEERGDGRVVRDCGAVR